MYQEKSYYLERSANKKLSRFIRSTATAAFFTVLSGCMISTPFKQYARKENKTDKIYTEYAFMVDYKTGQKMNSYSAEFRYCDPFNTEKVKSDINYIFNIRFDNNEYASLRLPFIINNDNIMFYFSLISANGSGCTSYKINVPAIKNNDRITEKICMNGKNIDVVIKDITLDWSREFALNKLTFNKSDKIKDNTGLKTGMEIILYLYGYPGALSLNGDIDCRLSKTKNPYVVLSTSVNENNVLKRIAYNKFKIRRDKNCYYFGNYSLTLSDNSFSISKLARRKAF